MEDSAVLDRFYLHLTKCEAPVVAMCGSPTDAVSIYGAVWLVEAIEVRMVTCLVPPCSLILHGTVGNVRVIVQVKGREALVVMIRHAVTCNTHPHIRHPFKMTST